MIKMKNFSVRQKLIAIQLVTTFVVLLLYSVFFGVSDLRQFKNAMLDELRSVAQLLGANSAAAVTFLDSAAAEEVLSSLEAEENIVNAWIHDAQGNLFATYSKPGYAGYSFPRVSRDTCHCEGNYLAMSRGIVHGGETIGTVTLRLSMAEYRTTAIRHVFMASLVLIIGMLVAFVLSLLTQKTISVPILNLVDTVRKVSDTGNYSLRVEKAANDEIGVLYDGYNGMMEQILLRERERDRVTESLRESEKNYRTIVENINDGMWIHDLHGTILDVNERACAMVGSRREDVIGTNLAEYSSRETLAEAGTDTDRIVNEGSALFDAEIERKDGTRIPISVSAKLVSKEGGGQIQSFVRDITERKRAEESLRESERRFKTLVSNIPGVTYRCALDAAWTMEFISDEIERMTGYPATDFLHNSVRSFASIIHPEDAEMVANVVEKAVRERSTYVIEYRIIGADGRPRWVHERGQGVFDEKGDVLCLDGAIFDISERKEAEELAQLRQQQLIQADKMATLGILVSGVAHEINNPNNFMLLNSNNLTDIWHDLRPLLDRRLDTDGDFMVAGMAYSEMREEVGTLIGGISEGAERIRKIVQSLKDFARPDAGSMNQPVKLNSVIESSAIILSNLIRKTTDNFAVRYDAALPEVRGNSQQLEQVIINLVSNACQALDDKRKSVRVGTAYDKESNHVVVTVADEGGGIKPEDLKHIFDPFFTTRRDSGGTGLGLSISYNIVKEHGGDLKMESSVGKGTVATITLPVAAA